MKKILRSLAPVFFGLMTSVIYVLLYPAPEPLFSAGHLKSLDFQTLLLVFLTGIGLVAAMQFQRKKSERPLFYIYISLAYGVPLVLLFGFGFFPTGELKGILGLMFLGMFNAVFFVSAYWKYREKKLAESQ